MQWRGAVYSELEKKNNGDVSRKASTAAILRASAPTLLKYMASYLSYFVLLMMMPEIGD